MLIIESIKIKEIVIFCHYKFSVQKKFLNAKVYKFYLLIGGCMIHDVSLKLEQKTHRIIILSFKYQRLNFKSRISCVGDGLFLFTMMVKFNYYISKINIVSSN